MRALALLSVIAACLALGTPGAAQPPTFRLQPLVELPGMESVALGVAGDPVSGVHVVGSSRDAMGVDQAVYWFAASVVDPNEAGVLGLLPSLDSTMPSLANGIRVAPSAGALPGTQAWGVTQNASGLGKPALWQDQGPFWTLTPLPTLASGEGMVCGGSPSDPFLLAGYSPDAAAIEKAVIWEPDSGGTWMIGPLPHPAPADAGEAQAVGHNTAGPMTVDVVGGWVMSGPVHLPQVWTRSGGVGPWTRTPLPLIGGGTEGMVLGAIETETGSVILTGWSENASSSQEAVLWEETSPGQWAYTGLGILPGFGQSEATAGSVLLVNPGGSVRPVCGRASLADQYSYRTMFWETGMSGTTAWDVNSLLPSTPTIPLQQATGMSMFVDGAQTGLLISCITGVDSLSMGAVSRSAAGPPHAALLVEETGPTAAPPRSEVVAIPLAAAPNPFRDVTKISFSLEKAGRVSVDVYDVAGRLVSHLAGGPRAAGIHTVSWSGKDNAGHQVRPGVYLVQIDFDGVTGAQKLVHLR